MLPKNVERAVDIFRPLVNDVVVFVGFNESTRRGSHGAAHVGDEESTAWLRADFIGDGGEKRAIALLKLRLVWVRNIEVIPSILSLKQRQKTSTPDSLAIFGDTYKQSGQ